MVNNAHKHVMRFTRIMISPFHNQIRTFKLVRVQTSWCAMLVQVFKSTLVLRAILLTKAESFVGSAEHQLFFLLPCARRHTRVSDQVRLSVGRYVCVLSKTLLLLPYHPKQAYLHNAWLYNSFPWKISTKSESLVQCYGHAFLIASPSSIIW